MEVKTSVKGDKELAATFSKLIANVDDRELTMSGANVVFDISQEIVAVDTGELKDSGEVIADGDDAKVKYSAEHAPFIEFGTSRMSAQPFLRPAIDATGRIMREVTQMLKRQIGI